LITTPSALDALWLDTLNRICGRAAHEVKGALNGVAVNLEVVRSRSSRPDAPASAVATFAASASSQFDAVMDMTDGLLALSRAPKGAIEGAKITRQFAALLGPVAKVDGRELVVDRSVESVGIIAIEGRAVQLAIGSVMLAAIESAQQVVCRGRPGVVELGSTDGRLSAPPEDVVVALKEVGIEVRADQSAISITFPR
jgi:hypothetical protein